MKTFLAILSVAGLCAASLPADPARHRDFDAAGKLAAEGKKDLPRDFTGSDWCAWGEKLTEEVFAPDEFRNGVVEGRWWIAQEEPAKDAASGKKEKGPKKQEGRGEAGLQKRIAEAKKKLAKVRRKIEADHAAWEKSEMEMEVAEARIAELTAALENEKVRYKQLEDVVVRIEKEHNGDHDLEGTLALQLAQREKALAAFAREQEVRKLEEQAEALRREAEKLRKRAEELKKN